MWICVACNDYVERPQKGWRCPHGHELFDNRILMPTKEQSFASSVGLGVLSAVVFTVFFWLMARYVSKNIFGNAVAIFGLLALPLLSLFAILRGLKWRRDGGAVARLAPRAFGTATGWFLFFLLLAAVYVLHLAGYTALFGN